MAADIITMSEIDLLCLSLVSAGSIIPAQTTVVIGIENKIKKLKRDRKR